MTRTHAFGIVGGYGSTGSDVASQLLKSTSGEVLVGGRDREKANALAAKLGSRVSAAQLDVLDMASLDEFCSRCSVIVNCAGPVMLLQDRVGQAALRARSHYVDIAGMTFVKEGMLPHAREIADLGLSFVVSAGWMPGLSELVPAYAHARARAKMHAIESVRIFYGDSGEWSENALRDAFWYLRKIGLPTPGYFHHGQWTRVKMSAASAKFDLGNPIGSRRFSVFSTHELKELGSHLTDCDVFAYSYLSGVQTALVATLIALCPLPESLGVRLMRGVFRRNRLPVDGFAAAQVLGRAQGRKCILAAHVLYHDRRDYWINALVPSLVARLIFEGNSVRRGVHFLADAVDPTSFTAAAQSAGVRLFESFSSYE